MLSLLVLVAAVETVPSRDALHNACYGNSGATQECVSMLAQAIIGHSKKCYEKHREREAYTACASNFCFSECGENEGCSELCDDKASEAYDFFAGIKHEQPDDEALLQKKETHTNGNDFFGNADRAADSSVGVAGIPTRSDLQAACYGGQGATQQCTELLAQAIIGHSKKCYQKHSEREAYTSCASTFCFSECGENEDCSELCDAKAKQAFDFFAHGQVKAADDEESFVQSKVVRKQAPELDYVSLAQQSTRVRETNFLRKARKTVDQHKCRVMCQRFMMKALGTAFAGIEHPTECMKKCDEVCTPNCPAVEAK